MLSGVFNFLERQDLSVNPSWPGTHNVDQDSLPLRAGLTLSSGFCSCPVFADCVIFNIYQLDLYFLQVLLGVLVASSRKGCLELRDLRGSLPCIPLTESSQPLIDPNLVGAKLRGGKVVVVGDRAQRRAQ